ncbi:hypothetical protein N7466_006371 [Penicillium verhagenii]|uniref:uncharacterized protein n=1 Tax=Penicillium verhagenii TaxID=1562060 RepID=UPI002544F8E2|nr:uncharacterized protein N7466_006371 [Penicillium verhagenii]KAJ5930878.1 hypothetical protein N7466_006371 [Penicillium verhagenii]
MPLNRLWFITTPRTASNLLIRILATDRQPNTIPGEYFCQQALNVLEESGCLEKPLGDWSSHEISKIGNIYQESFDQLQAFVKAAGDKRIVLKEHALFVIDPATRVRPADSAAKHELLCKVKNSEMSCLSLPDLPPNVTVFPDEFLASWFPVLLIRHPAVAFPSYYRTYSTHWAKTPEEREAMKGEIQTAMTLRWARSLYDWYLALWEQIGSDANLPRPIVLDAEDYMSDPEMIERFCDTVGLDSSKLQLSWEPASKEALENTDPGKRRMRDTLFASTCINPEKIKREISLQEEVQKWQLEFGEDDARKIADWVKSALPDYEFLRERRFT